MSSQSDQIFETELGVLGDLFSGSSTAKILDFLLMFREFDYSETDISRNAGVSTRHIYRSLPKLVDLNLVNQTRMSGRSRMYKLNADLPAIQALEKFVFEIAKTKINDDSLKSQSTQIQFEEAEEMPAE